MNHAILRFYAELNDFLPVELRQRTLRRWFDGPAPVKDVIEACGVPHTEVDVVLVNGDRVDFGCPVSDGDRVTAYPRFRLLDPAPADRLQPAMLADPRFVLDVHLGRLASYLRLAGFDAAYRRDCSDAELALVSHDQDRILLTRDRELLKRSIVERGYWVRDTHPPRQFAEVVRRFDLAERMMPLTRCARCNAVLTGVSRDAVADRLPPLVKLGRDTFRQCPGCERVYWDGTHVEQIRRILANALTAPPGD
ncbi:MAG: Mut7-C ubiquitin/RNAse domain-containing protein [Acidobacteria bacterium]|nr:Mut7-C ubiquitin/RNAse domain-containing protein [Acidobacteriota bacterium]